MKIIDQQDTVAMLAIGRMVELEGKIHSKTAGRIQNLQVESTGDAVIVSGCSSTYYAKQLATQILLDELGEMKLNNEICVS